MSTTKRSKPQILKAATNQEAFDKMVKHLFKQGGRAMDGSVCTYYDPETKNRCAVGALINGGLLRRQDRRTGITQLVERGIIGVPLGVSTNLLSAVQAVHDAGSYWYGDTLKPAAVRRLREVAEDFSLDTTVLEKLATKAGVAS
jgi:hypothetical protein